MNTYFFAGFPLVLCAFHATGVNAMTPQELCARVYEQYGVRSEECALTDEPPTALQATAISDETRESHVFFTRGGAVLDDDARLQLAALVQVLETSVMSRACLHLIGHSDTTGSSDRNEDLSKKRAEAVASALRAGLSDATRVREVSAHGEGTPLPGMSGRSPFNRRVEILARDCP
ncbi:OmpA family protein [Shimia sp. Alg240-R146]|uniref:OmpA family protein n=1 Tax=Shimia sp. Alg240-R146 TaxID=2993449 RepID=UPI0022E5DC49|nr:OmpA family protein [Shimia sp. Alg240-R146]